MSAADPPDHPRQPTVADVTFPDGREGLFGVRDTSTVRAALVAFALSKMSLRDEPVPVIAGSGAGADEPPRVGDVVGAIRVARLRELEGEHADDPVSAHIEDLPPTVPADLPAATALARLDGHEIALVVRGGDVVGVVSRRELTASVVGD